MEASSALATVPPVPTAPSAAATIPNLPVISINLGMGQIIVGALVAGWLLSKRNPQQ